MKKILSLIACFCTALAAIAQPQVAVNIVGTNSAGGPGGFQVTSTGVAFSGVVTGLTNTTTLFVGQFTNGSANAALAFATYYTNTFNRKIQADFTCSISNALGTSGSVAVYGFTAAGSARLPFFWGSAGTNLITNTIPYQLDAGGYFSVSNTTGSGLLVTNDVIGF